MKQGLMVAAGFVAALALSPLEAGAVSTTALGVTFSSPGSQGVATPAFSGLVNEAFTATFPFRLEFAPSDGSSTKISCLSGPGCADINFTDIKLYNDPGAAITTGIINFNGTFDVGTIASFGPLLAGNYLVEVVGKFVNGGTASIGGNISVVPVPAALPLMLVALAGLGLIARRKTDA